VPQGDFEAGYLRTLVSSAVADVDAIKREYTSGDVSAATLRVTATAGLDAIWTLYGRRIEDAPGIPDLRRDRRRINTSEQAGRCVALERNGVDAFFDAEWGAELAAELRAASRALGTCRVTATNGVITVVRGG
jgi:hypothetical protein